MKRRHIYYPSLLSLICFAIVFGCATRTKIVEPKGPVDTLLIGRLTLVCSGFPPAMGLNGEYMNGVAFEMMSARPAKGTISVIAKRTNGVFFLANPDDDKYDIVKYRATISSGSQVRFTISADVDDRIYLTRDSVNNLGDIVWRCEYHSRGSSRTTEAAYVTDYYTMQAIEYKENFEEVKNWFSDAYPESLWNSRNWVDVKKVVKP